mmetsp:Transcript_19304/g.13967  ORF Transcript_19304/g.13967 Transcript_19304/m.13967 type:complete len:101 (+) Transcript_19304:253-555(+)
MVIPAFYLLVVFFVIFTFVTEYVMYWVGVWYKLRKEQKKKIQEKQALLKKRKIQPVAVIRPTVKHMGFAFDSEQGHVPQITKKGHDSFDEVVEENEDEED